MALPSNDKIIGDPGHTADHNAIVDEITYVKQNYYSASSTGVNLPEYLRRDSASSTYATIFSPAFSGIPTAPTAASSSNSTQIATTEFVKSAISNIIDFAPETLDTLNELAAAIADDPNFSTTITNSLSSKLDSATASSVYLSISSASATYIGKDNIIDCGGP